MAAPAGHLEVESRYCLAVSPASRYLQLPLSQIKRQQRVCKVGDRLSSSGGCGGVCGLAEP